MSIENHLYSRLSGFAGLAALVGTRIYPVRAAQGTARPYVTLQQVAGPRLSAMGVDNGIVLARYQIDSWGATYDSSRTVAKQVRLALQRYRGTIDGTEILDIFIQNELEFDEERTRLFRVMQDYAVHHRE